MRRAFSLAVFVLLGAGTLPGQTPPPPEENLQLVATGSPGVYTLSWFARAGRTYFVQYSEDLHDAWLYLDLIAGADAYETLGILDPPPTAFFRLQYTDQTAANPESADFDGDGLSNSLEISGQEPTNPLKADSDGDGSTDGEEIAAQTDPLTPGNAAGAWSTANIVGGALQEGAVFLIVDEEGNCHGVTKPAMLLKSTNL